MRKLVSNICSDGMLQPCLRLFCNLISVVENEIKDNSMSTQDIPSVTVPIRMLMGVVYVHVRVQITVTSKVNKNVYLQKGYEEEIWLTISPGRNI